uniref:hypothetical protein n=2 Tax=Flavobacterium sp. TaxID=239 RepID=UPI00404AC926
MSITLYSQSSGIQQNVIQNIDSKIIEVYQNELNIILERDPERITFINKLLNERIKYMEDKLTSTDKYKKLSEVTLFNKYNENLTRDTVFDPQTFNPLKYKFNFYSQFTQVYRVDNSDYVIVIESQRK